MSILGLVSLRGSTVDVRRAAESAKPEGDAALAWSEVSAATAMRLEQQSARRIQRLIGRETTATMLGLCAPGVDVLEDDAVVVTAGLHAGTAYRVDGTVLVEGRHLALALVRLQAAPSLSGGDFSDDFNDDFSS